MSQRIWNLRWRAAALLIIAIGCGYWTAGACAPAGPQNSCEALPDGSDNTKGFEIKLNTTSSQGRQVAYTRRIMTVPETGAVKIETEVTADGQLIMSMVSSADSMGTQVQIEYGPLAPGAASANAVVKDGMVTGMVDGRAMTPMPLEGLVAANAGFEDGAPPPDLGVDTDLQQAVTTLFEAAESAGETCQAQNGNTQKQVRRQLPTQDTGHDSDPEATAGCVACWASCSANAVGCITGASAGCGALWICPPCLAACEVAVIAGCAGITVGCYAACNANGAVCCPVACGDVACCEQGESCLNADIGLCCSEHKKTCLDQACCENTQTCIDFGPNAGTCCEPEDVCGNTCCDPTDSCNAAENLCCPADVELCDDKCCDPGEACIDDGVCCDPVNACGTACCDELDSCIESLSLCCNFNEPPCNDKCCDSGESCIDGTTCCPTNLVCGSVCCPQGTSCDSQTLTCTACPNPTDTACTVGGCCPAGKFCQDVEGICCDQGELYCNGACRPLNECIK